MIIVFDSEVCKRRYGHYQGLVKLWEIEVSDKVVLSIRLSNDLEFVTVYVSYMELGWSTSVYSDELDSDLFDSKGKFIEWLHGRPFSSFRQSIKQRFDKELFCDS